jgi:pyruvate dehydrogenase E2 component (dihydrolipoamide acetyltransferase)
MSLERVKKLDYADRWLRDGLKAVDPPGGLLTTEADMTSAVELRQAFRDKGVPITYTHLIVRAAAVALARNPDLHHLTAGNRRLQPAGVDICLSIAGEGAVTPVLILKDADRRSLASLAREVKERAHEVRLADEKTMRLLRRCGWLIPGAHFRTALIRFLLSRVGYRRMVSGTFQVTVVSNVDVAVPFLFNTAAALGAGQVRDRVIAIDGQARVRPTVILACCCNHTMWNGMDAARFLNAVKAELEAPISRQPAE